MLLPESCFFQIGLNSVYRLFIHLVLSLCSFYHFSIQLFYEKTIFLSCSSITTDGSVDLLSSTSSPLRYFSSIKRCPSRRCLYIMLLSSLPTINARSEEHTSELQSP